MTTSSNSALLKTLIDEYYHDRLSFEQYRARRRTLLDSVEQQYNGALPPASAASIAADAEPEPIAEDEELTIRTIPAFGRERRSRPRNNDEA